MASNIDVYQMPYVVRYSDEHGIPLGVRGFSRQPSNSEIRDTPLWAATGEFEILERRYETIHSGAKEDILRFEIAIFEEDRGYGGSEEGGWWYNCGERLRVLKRTFSTRDEAVEVCRRVNGWLDRMRHPSVRSPSSVAYDGGWYGARVYEQGESPAFYPESRPRYE